MNKKISLGFMPFLALITMCFMSITVPAQKRLSSKSDNNAAQSPSATLLVEDFTYPAGSLLTNNGWTAHSGGGTNAIATSTPGLTLTGYPSSGVGNSVALATSGEDDNRTFTAQTSGSVYASFLVNASDAVNEATGIGGYFFHLGPDPIGTTFRGRVFMKKDASNNIAFGISKAGSTDATTIAFTPFSYALNTTYLVVVKYTIVDGATNDTVSLIVSTTVPATEPAPTATAPDVTATDINPASVALRQGAATTSPTLRVDGIRVGTDWTIVTGGSTTPANVQHVVDFNGDGKTDYAVVRNMGTGATGQIRWYIYLNGINNYYGADFGLAIDALTPADYDGDKKTDIAVWRSGASGVASFYILQSTDNTVKIDAFGQEGDDPSVIGDYDGDGKADVAVYRDGATSGAQSFWYYRGTLNNAARNITFFPWGSSGDSPAPGDYDGDGKNDFVVERDGGDGQSRYFLNKTSGSIEYYVAFGRHSDSIVPGDYDGDGKTDLAVARDNGSNYEWYYRSSINGSLQGTVWGNPATDYLTQGDYDGDGKTDFAIWRTSSTAGGSAFWIKGSSGANTVFQFGQGDVNGPFTGDAPVANYNEH